MVQESSGHSKVKNLDQKTEHYKIKATSSENNNLSMTQLSSLNVMFASWGHATDLRSYRRCSSFDLKTAHPSHPMPSSVKFLHILCHAKQGSPKNLLVLEVQLLSALVPYLSIRNITQNRELNHQKMFEKVSKKVLPLWNPFLPFHLGLLSTPDSPTPSLGASHRSSFSQVSLQSNDFYSAPKNREKERCSSQKKCFKVAKTFVFTIFTVFGSFI